MCTVWRMQNLCKPCTQTASLLPTFCTTQRLRKTLCTVSAKCHMPPCQSSGGAEAKSGAWMQCFGNVSPRQQCRHDCWVCMGEHGQHINALREAMDAKVPYPAGGRRWRCFTCFAPRPRPLRCWTPSSRRSAGGSGGRCMRCMFDEATKLVLRAIITHSCTLSRCVLE
jgi:hypothetical protein